MTISSRPLVRQQRRRRVRVGRLRHGVSRPLDPPSGLARQFVDRQHVGRIVGLHAVQDFDVEMVFVEERRRRVAPVQAERAVVLLNVARPDLLAAEVERLEDARAGHHPDVRAIGDRRRRRHVLLAYLGVAGAEMGLPALGARVSIDAHEVQLGAVGHVQEDPVAPDDGRRSRQVRQREFPRHVLGRASRSRAPGGRWRRRSWTARATAASSRRRRRSEPPARARPK